MTQSPVERPTPTGVRTRAAAETIVVAAGLGLLADLLFRDAPLGLNALLWVMALVAALTYTGRHREAPASPVELACLALSLAAAAGLTWRASDPLRALLFLASGAFLVLGVAVRSGLPSRRAGVAMLSGALVAAGLAIAAGVVRAQSRMEFQDGLLRRSQEGVTTAIRVVVIAVPVLLVFGLLFASADAVFEDRLARLTDFDLSGIASHAAWFVAGAWFAGGVTWASYEGRRIRVPEPRLPETWRLGPIEIGVILGALTALFAAFVAIQLRYLFGGHELVQQTTGLTYAEYARRGFFELVTTSVLLLPLLLVADWARRRGGAADAVYRLAAGLLVILLFVIMASALLRVNAYEQAYGLTADRLYAVAILLGLATVFALFLRTLVAAHNGWFVAGSIAAAAVVLALLTAIGPDALIAQRNLDRAAAGHPFDAEHAARLGADAAPVLVRGIDTLAPAEACTVARSLLDRWGGGSGDSLRSWSVARFAAARAVREASSDLARACAGHPGGPSAGGGA